MDKNQIIEKVVGNMAVSGKVYHSPLSPTLAEWYVYTRDGGHSILCILSRDLKEIEAGEEPVNYLVPVPVKAVLNQNPKFYQDFVVVDMKYSPHLGLIFEDDDEEF